MTLDGLSDGLLVDPMSCRPIQWSSRYKGGMQSPQNNGVCRWMTKDIVRTTLRSPTPSPRQPFLYLDNNSPHCHASTMQYSSILDRCHRCHRCHLCFYCLRWRVAVQISAIPSRKHLQPLRNCEDVCAQPATLNKRDGSESGTTTATTRDLTWWRARRQG